MRIPENIEELIDERERLAACLNSADYKLSEWLEKNNIDADMDDIHGGCEMYVNPGASANRIRQAILEKEVAYGK